MRKKELKCLLLDGIAGIGVCAMVLFFWLFLNDAGKIVVTEPGPAWGLIRVVGWPFYIATSVVALSAWGGDGMTLTLTVAFLAGILVNIVYAFGLGVLFGRLIRLH